MVTYVMQKQKIHWANGLNAVLAISPSKSDPSIDTLNVNMIVQVSTTASFKKKNLLMGNIRITSFYQSIDLKKT